QVVVGDAPPPGRHVLGVEFTKQTVGDYREPHGTLRLHVDEEVIAEGEIRTQAGRFALCGEGLCIGFDGGDAVSGEYQPPFTFTGGTINKVTFDVGDDAYDDVELQFAAAMARD